MARVKINRTKSRAYARDWAADKVDPLCRQIELTAKAMVPVKTGATRMSITTTRSNTPTRITRRVGSRRSIALLLHRGAKPHRIVPRNRGGRLVFFWKKVGRRVSLPKVNHPGFDGTRYLTTPLVAYATAAGFRVTLRNP